MGCAVLELKRTVGNKDTGDSTTKEVTNIEVRLQTGRTRGQKGTSEHRRTGKSPRQKEAMAKEEGSKAGPWRNHFCEVRAPGASGGWKG